MRALSCEINRRWFGTHGWSRPIELCVQTPAYVLAQCIYLTLFGANQLGGSGISFAGTHQSGQPKRQRSGVLHCSPHFCKCTLLNKRDKRRSVPNLLSLLIAIQDCGVRLFQICTDSRVGSRYCVTPDRHPLIVTVSDASDAELGDLQGMIYDAESAIVRELDGGIKSNAKHLQEIGRILCDLDWCALRLLLCAIALTRLSTAVC
jgi:hypothetical protein